MFDLTVLHLVSQFQSDYQLNRQTRVKLLTNTIDCCARGLTHFGLYFTFLCVSLRVG